MSKKTIYFILAITLIAGVVVTYLSFFNNNINIINAPAEKTVSARKLTTNFIENEKSANKTYNGKVIKVFGIIKEITFLNKTNTIILHSDHKNFSVLCDMQFDSSSGFQNLKVGQKITVKGICKGFLHDVILLNCMLVNTKNNE